MTRINTNVPAIRAINRLDVNQKELNLRLQRLATGLRINTARDDPAGLIISELLRSDIRTIQQAIENSTRANFVIATAEGAMNEMSAQLLELQGLIVESSNKAGLTQGELEANQLAIDSILDSIDRIASTTAFAGKKLLDGSLAYTLSGVVPSALTSVSVFAAHVPIGGTREIVVRVTQSAQTAQIAMVGQNSGGVSLVSASTIELKGTLGRQLLSFADGTTLAEVRTAINSTTDLTGVSAVVSAAGGAASALLLNSRTLGTKGFVSVEPISGNFVESGNAGTTIRGVGVEAGLLVNGQVAGVSGLRADVRGQLFDARVFLTQEFAQTIGSTTFHVTGGGALFQLTPEISPSGQAFVGFAAFTSTKLGNSQVGLLHTLRSGSTNDLSSENFPTAQNIVEAAINQVASQRGRLGSVQRSHIDANIESQRVALENVTAAESIIRDADMAVEVSALTRAQILVQSTLATLEIANAAPQSVLSLLR
ncbi:MAG: flagellin [Planctomycetes bacterium]|nr:flagellin [Planctomycetota bacterium]